MNQRPPCRKRTWDDPAGDIGTVNLEIRHKVVPLAFSRHVSLTHAQKQKKLRAPHTRFPPSPTLQATTTTPTPPPPPPLPPLHSPTTAAPHCHLHAVASPLPTPTHLSRAPHASPFLTPDTAANPFFAAVDVDSPMHDAPPSPISDFDSTEFSQDRDFDMAGYPWQQSQDQSSVVLGYKTGPKNAVEGSRAGMKEGGAASRFRMGFQPGCEKCRLKEPGHYSHI
jgi:hypothetical protein